MTINPMNSWAYRGLVHAGERLILVNRDHTLTVVGVPEPDLGGYVIPDEGHVPFSTASMIQVNTRTSSIFYQNILMGTN